ncbi:MAG: hypothetical protein NC337_02500 [Roseburia sp.]|nr:hypothetical protein [Roseburia sp.]
MRSFFNQIRSIQTRLPVWKQIAYTAGFLLLGAALGCFSKYLDGTPRNTLMYIVQYLDVPNFLGRFPIWVLIALAISVYSKAPLRASANVFAFFVGMVASYYLYSRFILGFFPRSYALVWAGFTLLSPVLAFLCWYAKGKGKAALVLSAGILAVLFNMTFVYGRGYFEARSLLELLTFALSILVLRRSGREMAIMAGLAVPMALILDTIVPFHFG